MDPTYRLAENLVDTTYEDLPPEVVKVTKIEILDSLGVALAGSTGPGVRELFRLLKGYGGKKQSSVIAADTKLPVFHAAQVNATMIHALDFDDVLLRVSLHPACIVVPTCLAVAEHVGKISGKECIAAIALGVDLMTRLGLATKYPRGLRVAGWHLTSLYGVFGAAAITGRLLGLNQAKMVDALGLAYHQASGNLQVVVDGALAKRMGPGMAVKDGIMAALMAKAGITGAKNCMEGEKGLYRLYHNGGYDGQALLQHLGKTFEGWDLTIKPHPCCRITHSCVDATLELVKQHHITPEQVREITVYGGEAEYSMMCTPLEIKRKPRNCVDSIASIPWTVATAIVKGRVSMADFTEEAIKNEEVLRMAQKINAELAPDLIRHSGPEPGRVKITTTRGTYTKQVDYAYGDPKNPVTFADVMSKFYDCASHSIKPIPAENIHKLAELVQGLEAADDVAEIMKLIG
jgi:2-methylcitrate dehydratase PrpD